MARALSPRSTAIPTLSSKSVHALIAGAGAALVAWATAPWGSGIDNDAVDFASAADGLLAGEGFLQSDGEPFSFWPPLPPLTLAAGKICGVSYPATAQVFGVVSMFLVAYLTADLVWRWTRSLGASSACALALAASTALHESMVTARSEPLFVALCVAGVRYGFLYLETRRRAALVGATVATALACLQRYLGVTLLVALGAVLLALPREEPWLARARRGITFGVLASLPLVAWGLRNLDRVGRWTGPRAPGGPALSWVLSKSERVVHSWFFGSESVALPGAAALLFFVAIPAALCLRGQRDASRRGPTLFVLWAFPLAYLAISSALNHRFKTDGIAHRQLVPLVPFAWILLCVAVEHLRQWPSRVAWRRAIACLAVSIFALHLTLAGSELRRRVLAWRDSGAGVYNMRARVESDFSTWVSEHPLEGAVYSNDLHAVYWLCKRRTRALPTRRGAFLGLAHPRDGGPPPRHIVWFKHNSRAVLPIELLREHFALELIARMPGGEVYALEPL